MFPITALVGVNASAFPPSMTPPVIFEEAVDALGEATMLAAPDLAAPTGVGAANEVLAETAAEDETSGTGAVVSESGTSTSPSLRTVSVECQYWIECSGRTYHKHLHQEYTLEDVAVLIPTAHLRFVQLTLGSA